MVRMRHLQVVLDKKDLDFHCMSRCLRHTVTIDGGELFLDHESVVTFIRSFR